MFLTESLSNVFLTSRLIKHTKAIVVTSIILVASGCSTTPIFLANFDDDAINGLPAANPPGAPNKDLFRIATQNLLKVIVWDSLNTSAIDDPANHSLEITHGIKMDDELLVPAPQFLAFPQNTYETGPYTQGKFDVFFLAYVPVSNYNVNDEFFVLLSKNNDVAKITGIWTSGGIKGKGGQLYAISANGEQLLGVSYAPGDELLINMTLDLDQSTVSIGATNMGVPPISGERLDDLPMMGTSKSFTALAFGLLRPTSTGPGLPGKLVVDNIRIGTDEDNVQPD